jgi:hypothetical protein
MADNILELKEKFHQLQSEVVEMGMRRSVSKERLNALHNEIDAESHCKDLMVTTN